MKMNLISVEKAKLLRIITDNKEEHVKEYEEAMKGYRVGVVAGLEKLGENVKEFAKEVDESLEEARNGGELKTHFTLDLWSPFTNLTKPETHEKDYTTVIGMIDLDMGDSVDLSRDEYRNYIQDEWDWSATFETQITGSLGNYTQFSGSAATIKSYGK